MSDDQLTLQRYSKQLMERLGEHLVTWLPGGQILDGYYVCGGFRGGMGDTLRVSLSNGAWQDQVSGKTGGPLSLYAAIHDLDPVQAAELLLERGDLSEPSSPPAPVESPEITVEMTGVNQTVINLTEEADEPPLPVSMVALHQRLGIQTLGKSGQPVCNADNVLRVLEAETKFIAHGLCWFDEFQQRYFTSWDGPVREWNDTDLITLTIKLQREYGFRKASKEMVSDAVTRWAHQGARNSLAEWLKGLTWDGTPRIAQALTLGFGATASAYTEAVSSNFWISMAARALHPGCKMDTMVVLEGRQGTYKSTGLSVIGGPFYAELNESVMSKDFFLALQGKLLIEIADMDAFERAEITRIKQVLTCRADRYRSPYGRYAADHPRRCVFVGTTNETSYLRDPTGARRFWPIECGRVDLGWLRESRESCFAEAVARLSQGGSWWQVPREDAEAEQEARRQRDPWEEMIGSWLAGQTMREEITTGELASEVLHLAPRDCTRATTMRIGAVLRSLGWHHRRRITSDGQQRWLYLRPDDPTA